MGYLHQGVCYPELPQARREVCGQASQQWQSGSTIYTSSCTSTDFNTDSMTVCRRADGGACNTVAIPYPSFPSCDHSAGADLAYDWGIAAIAILVVIYGGKQLMRLFEVHHNPD